MSEQFSILIDSRTRFETGVPGGVWLSMPTTKEQLHEAMQRVGITADNPQDFFINGFMNTEQQPFDVPLPVIQSAGLDELNYLWYQKKPLHSILPMKWHRQLFIVNATDGRRIRRGACFSLLAQKKLKRLL